ncbi:MAG: sensor histidine kinase, partial [Nitrosotalea sp.]
ANIVGKSFHDNMKLNTALQGKTVSGISNLKDSDDDAERANNSQMMEIYIPIKTKSGQTYGVVELYLATDLINVYTSNTNWMVSVITIIGTAMFGFILFLTFIEFRKNVIIPVATIHELAKKIQTGDFNVKSRPSGYNELKMLGVEFETMANKLQEQQNIIAKTERVSAIGQLAARLAHDLRNPLSVIRNSLHLIRQKYSEKPEVVNSFERIDRSVFRMTHQIENVMDFVSPKPLIFESVSLKKLLNHAIEKINIADTLRINLPQNDTTITCDPNSLEVAFENLLLNAKQAMKNEGVIDIKISDESNFIQIHITDSGTGIPDDVLPRIFEPLFTTKQEGTGLGLSSCKSVIEKHGGTIEVKTQIGKGTTFIIKIPKIKFETQSVPSDKNNHLQIQQVEEKKISGK